MPLSTALQPSVHLRPGPTSPLSPHLPRTPFTLCPSSITPNTLSPHHPQVACGYNHTIAVCSDGGVWTWGFGGYGRLGHKVQQDEFKPRLVEVLMGRVQVPADARVAAGQTASFCTITGGQLFAWGKLKPSGEWVVGCLPACFDACLPVPSCLLRCCLPACVGRAKDRPRGEAYKWGRLLVAAASCASCKALSLAHLSSWSCTFASSDRLLSLPCPASLSS